MMSAYTVMRIKDVLRTQVVLCAWMWTDNMHDCVHHLQCWVLLLSGLLDLTWKWSVMKAHWEFHLRSYFKFWCLFDQCGVIWTVLANGQSLSVATSGLYLNLTQSVLCNYSQGYMTEGYKVSPGPAIQSFQPIIRQDSTSSPCLPQHTDVGQKQMYITNYLIGESLA